MSIKKRIVKPINLPFKKTYKILIITEYLNSELRNAINSMTNEEFVFSVTNAEDQLFYWTQLENALKEIEKAKPEYVISIGRKASMLLLKYSMINRHWMFDVLEKELETVLRRKTLRWTKGKYKMFVLPHPAFTRRVGTCLFENERLKYAFKEFIKGLRRKGL